MKIRKEFNRLTGFLGEGLERAHDVTDDLSRRMKREANTAITQARHSFAPRRSNVRSAEEMLKYHLRDNAALYIVIGLALVGLFAVRVLTRPDFSENDW